MQKQLGMETELEPFTYIVNGVKNSFYECEQSRQFLDEFKVYYAKKQGISINEIEINFINFGAMSLVYTLEYDNKIDTILLKYPNIEKSALRREAELLTHFSKINNNVVQPILYYSKNYGQNDRELFVTPYFYQARAISNFKGKFGFYCPEPEYKFLICNDKQATVLKQCIIAHIVASFDKNKKCGISKIEIIGGDFILEKDWDLNQPTIKNTFNKIKLIAARDTINCSFKQYLDLIRQEFVLNTKNPDNYKPNNNYILNTCNEVPFTQDEIEQGINLGIKISQQREYCNDLELQL